MIKWIRTSRFSVKHSLSLNESGSAADAKKEAKEAKADKKDKDKKVPPALNFGSNHFSQFP